MPLTLPSHNRGALAKGGSPLVANLVAFWGTKGVVEGNRPAEHESRFVSLVSSRQPTPNLWTDAWLAALAISLDYEFTTFDRGFKSFRGLKLRLLEMPDR